MPGIQGGLSEFIGVKREAKTLGQVKEKLRKVTAKKEKKKACQDCKNFQFFKTLNLQDQYYVPAAIFQEGKEARTVAFILTPPDFENLTRYHWKHIIASSLQEFNVLFLSYPKCYRNAFDEKLATPTVLRYCGELFIKKSLEAFAVDLVVVTPGTKNILEILEYPKIEFPGNWGELYGVIAFCAKHFYSIEKRGFNNESLQHAGQRIRRYFAGELAWQREQDFRLVTDEAGLTAAIKDIMEQEAVALDIETSGLDPQAEGFVIKTIGVFFPKRAYCIGYEVEECLNMDYQRKVKEFIQALFASKDVKKICHHLKFEQKCFIYRMDVTDFNSCEDTMFLSYLFDELRYSNGLKFLAGEYFDGYREKPQDFRTAKLQDLFFYNCMDARYTYMLWAITFDFENLAEQFRAGLAYVYYNVMLPLSYELALMELNGVQVDYEYLTTLQKKMRDEDNVILKKMADEYPQMAGRDVDSPKQLADVLFTILRFPGLKPTKTGYSVDSQVLKDLVEKHQCTLAQYVLEHRNKKVRLSTFIDPYIEKRAEYKGDRARSNYSQVKSLGSGDDQKGGTVSGRLTSRNPNLQNIPRDKDVKRMFIPTKGGERVILQADESQVELRIAASLANEANMLGIYERDEDIHEKTGLAIADPVKVKQLIILTGDAYDRMLKPIRQGAKACNFGMIYGGSHIVLLNVAKYQYGVNMSEDEARVARQRFFAAYPGLVEWHKTTQAFAAANGYVISPLGRVRRLAGVYQLDPRSQEYGELMRISLNSPVQCTSADLLSELWDGTAKEIRRRGLDGGVRIIKGDRLPNAFSILTVHDSLGWDCLNKDVALEVKDIMVQKSKSMEEQHRQTWLKCPFKVDYEISSKSWGDLEKVK